jgi:hypothetical protein
VAVSTPEKSVSSPLVYAVEDDLDLFLKSLVEDDLNLKPLVRNLVKGLFKWLLSARLEAFLLVASFCLLSALFAASSLSRSSLSSSWAAPFFDTGTSFAGAGAAAAAADPVVDRLADPPACDGATLGPDAFEPWADLKCFDSAALESLSCRLPLPDSEIALLVETERMERSAHTVSGTIDLRPSVDELPLELSPAELVESSVVLNTCLVRVVRVPVVRVALVPEVLLFADLLAAFAVPLALVPAVAFFLDALALTGAMAPTGDVTAGTGFPAFCFRIFSLYAL